MRRLILMLMAAATLAGPMVLAADAYAQGRGRGEHGRGWEPRDRGHDGGRWERGRGQGNGRWHREDRPRQRSYPQQRYQSPRPYYAPPPSYGMRRGGYLPPDYRGAMLGDYRRYRLRPPPPGYDWYRVGDDYLLVSRMNGLIFDVIRP